MWSGLISTYYLQRWKNYYESRDKGIEFDFQKWEKMWVENDEGIENKIVDIDVISFAKLMMDLSKDISWDDLKFRNDDTILGYWSLNEESEKEFVFQVPSKYINNYSDIIVKQVKGNEGMEILSCDFKADGKIINMPYIENKKTYDFSVVKNTKANNECLLIIKIKSEKPVSGIIVLK